MTRRGLRRFLTLPGSPRRIRALVDEELQFDIEMRTRELIVAGQTAAAAREGAIAEFGNLEETRRYCADLDMQYESTERRAHFLSDLRSDAIIAWRTMRRTPGFALVVLATLALGIGANTTVFSVIRRVLISPLPYRAPDQLYRLYTTPITPDGDDDKLSAIELADLAASSHSIVGVTYSGNYGSVTYTDEQNAESWETAQVATNFFDLLGVHPLLGRVFGADDFVQGASPVVIITFPLWQRVFGGDRDIVGRAVQLNSTAVTVIGVLPPSFVGPMLRAEALRPLNVPAVLQMAQYSRQRVWRAIARVRDGVGLATLTSELDVLRARERTNHPEIRNAGMVRPVLLRDAMVGSARAVLLLVMAGAALVLLITCVNIAGLFLSRAAARRRELGVRAALGAGRGRLMRQVLTESALYGLAGGAAGVALAFAMKRAFMHVAAGALPQMGDVQIDGGALTFAAVVSIACGLAFGIIPARAATRVDLRDAIGDSGGRGVSQGRSIIRGTSALVSAQIALAIVLLVGAGLLVRTFVTLVRTDVGYRTDVHVLNFHANLPPAHYQGDAGRQFRRTFLTRLDALPGVKAAGITGVTPWNGGMMTVGFHIVGRPVAPSAVPIIQFATASDGFFDAVGIPVRAGRAMTANDRADAPPVIVISESVARRFWPNTSPIGAQVTLDTGDADSLLVREIVGVVGDVRPSVNEDIVPTVYGSAWQGGSYGGEFVARTSGDATALVAPIKQLLHELDPRVPLLFPRTMRDVLRASVQRQQLAMALMGAFAVLALVLAALGVYSVMAYAVLSRTREFGVRTALGAERGSIMALVLRQGLGTAAAGVVCGIVLAAMVSRFVSAMLVGVSVHDPVTFVVAPVLMIITATLACLLPARAATRVQPMEALRVE